MVSNLLNLVLIVSQMNSAAICIADFEYIFVKAHGPAESHTVLWYTFTMTTEACIYTSENAKNEGSVSSIHKMVLFALGLIQVLILDKYLLRNLVLKDSKIGT